jgi:hypothetical protein
LHKRTISCIVIHRSIVACNSLVQLASFCIRCSARILNTRAKEDHMLWTIAVVLIILWLLGFVSNYTMGGFIHILLVVAIVVILVRVIQGRKIIK